MGSKVFREAVAKIKDELHFLEENDPNLDRSSTVSRDVLNNLFCYAETLRKERKEKNKTSILQYLKQWISIQLVVDDR